MNSGDFDNKVRDNKIRENFVILKFLEPYDKYLFEGVIKPEDLFKRFTSGDDGASLLKTSDFLLEFEENSNLHPRGLNLYVLNTLDSRTFFKSLEDDNFTFFNSIVPKETWTLRVCPDRLEESKSLEDFILLLAPQNPKVFDKVVELFYNKVKIRKNVSENVYVFNSSSTLGTFLQSQVPEFSKFPKHFFIDLSLSLSAIEMFKNLKNPIGLKNLEGLPGKFSISLSSLGFEIPKPESLKHLKDLKIYVPGFSKETLDVKRPDRHEVSRSLEIFKSEPEIKRLRNFFNSNHHEDYLKRLIPLIPYVPFRLKDKIETFHLQNSLKPLKTLDVSRPQGSKPLILQISKRFIKEIYRRFTSGSVLDGLRSRTQSHSGSVENGPRTEGSDLFPYLFAIPWTHIYIENEEVDFEILEMLYNNINEIYVQKRYKTYIKDLKLNHSYSLIRESLHSFGFKSEDFDETYKSNAIKFLDKNTPAISLGVSEISVIKISETPNTLIL